MAIFNVVGRGHWVEWGCGGVVVVAGLVVTHVGGDGSRGCGRQRCHVGGGGCCAWQRFLVKVPL